MKKKLERQPKELSRELSSRRILRKDASQQRTQDRSATHNLTAAQANDQLKHTLSELVIERERLLDIGKENEAQLHNVHEKIGELSGSLTKNTDLLVESKVKSEVNSFKLSMIAQEIQELEVQFRLGEEEL